MNTNTKQLTEQLVAVVRSCGQVMLNAKRDDSMIDEKSGHAELFFELRLSPCDFAAAGLICQEAGGVVTTVDGEPFTLDRQCSILASNGAAEI